MKLFLKIMAVVLLAAVGIFVATLLFTDRADAGGGQGVIPAGDCNRFCFGSSLDPGDDGDGDPGEPVPSTGASSPQVNLVQHVQQTSTTGFSSRLQFTAISHSSWNQSASLAQPR